MNHTAEPGHPGAKGPPSAILAKHRKDILARWEREVRRLKAARPLNRDELFDHLPSLLDRIGKIADKLAAGRPPDKPPPEAAAHGAERQQSGFDMAHLILEYGILRRTIAHFCEGDPAAAAALDEAIDRALVGSAERFASERERALRDTRRSVRRLEGILSAIPDGVFVADESGRVVLANESAERIFGVPREELLIPLSDYPRRFNLRTPEGEPAVPVLVRALAGEVVPPVERVITPAPGPEDRHLRTSAAPLRGDDGSVEGAVVIYGDITDRRQAELAVREAARLREEILAVVSHDLRNPLGAIRMSAEILLRRGPEPRDRKQLDTIQRSADRMERLITDLLDVANIKAGRFAVEPQDLDLCPLIDEAVDAHLPLAQAKGVTLRRELTDPCVLATLDRGRTFQILSNLLGNAIKFCSAGDTIVVRAGPGSGGAQVSVADTGPGIPEADLQRIFEPYWSDRSRSKQGTGLGLFISKGIVEAQGGRIWVESRPGDGATFHFTLPLARPHRPPESRRAPLGIEATPPPSKPNTI